MARPMRSSARRRPGQIFQTRDRSTARTQIAFRRRKIMRHLEDGIDAEALTASLPSS